MSAEYLRPPFSLGERSFLPNPIKFDTRSKKVLLYKESRTSKKYIHNITLLIETNASYDGYQCPLCAGIHFTAERESNRMSHGVERNELQTASLTVTCQCIREREREGGIALAEGNAIGQWVTSRVLRIKQCRQGYLICRTLSILTLL